MIRINKPFNAIQRFVVPQGALQIFNQPQGALQIYNQPQREVMVLNPALQNLPIDVTAQFNTATVYPLPNFNNESIRALSVQQPRKPSEPLDLTTKLFIGALGLTVLSGGVFMFVQKPILFMVMILLIFSK